MTEAVKKSKRRGGIYRNDSRLLERNRKHKESCFKYTL